MDSLNYAYNRDGNGNLTSNRLRHVKDAIGNANYTEDIDNQADDNYDYDATGNLVKDTKEGIDNIDWTVYGKIKKITKTDNTTISYTYDVAGNRISKTVIPPSGGGGVTTWYSRDASGNVMAVYTGSGSSLVLSEQHIYGSSRLGVWNRSIDMDVSPNANNYTFTRGNKFFELSNHLQNVLVTVSDKKIGVDNNSDGNVDYYNADVVTANDFYPFGSQMPGRKYSQANRTYRYGFNGKENDNEVKGEGNQQDYGMRIYDPRVGRFLSVDPISNELPWNSPYTFAENDVIRNIDLDGLEKVDPNQLETVKKWMKWHEKNYLSTKDLLQKTTDKTVRANLQKCMDQSKESYGKLVKFLYTNKLTDVEIATFYTDKAIEISKEVADLTPVGDVKVLATGKNFKNEKQSRLLAAGFIVLDIFGGEIFSFAGKAGKTSLSVLSKGLTYAGQVGKCGEFATEFVSKFKRVFKEAGAQMTMYEINIGNEGLIGTATQQLASNGNHTFVEVVKNGKSMIFDNLHPEGMVKEEYMEKLAGHTASGENISGKDLLEKYATKKEGKQ